MSIFNEAMNGQLAGLDFVQGRIDLGDQQRKERGLASLMGDYAAGGAPDYRGIAANGGNPLAVREDSEQRKAMRLKELSQFAGYLAQLPPEARPQAYASLMPKLAPIGQELGLPPLPPAWDETHLPELQALAQLGMQQSSAGIQSTFVDANGQRVGITRDGRTVVLGQNAPNVQILEGQGGFYGVNKGNLQAAPVTMGGPMQAPQPQGVMAGDVAPPSGPLSRGAAMSYVQQAEAANGAPFPVPVRMQMIDQLTRTGRIDTTQPQAAPAATGQQLQPAAKPQAQRAPTELERRVEMARAMGATPEEVKRLVVGGGQTGNAQAQKAGQANRIKMAQLDTVQRQIDRLDKAAQSVAGNRIFDGGPLDQFAIKWTPQGQELEQSAAAIMPVLTALTRVPGVGAQSDLESRLASLQLPSANLAPEVNRAAVQALREYMADLKKAYEAIGGQQPAKAPAAAGGWSIQAIP